MFPLRVSYLQIIKVLTPLKIFPFLLLIFRISPSLSSFLAHTLLVILDGIFSDLALILFSVVSHFFHEI